jgi:hypothetical protein
MSRLLALLALLALAVAPACTTKAKARAEAQRAFLAGQNQSLQQQSLANAVTVRGPVRHPVIAWTEDLTLARALVAAEYTGLRDPREIFVIRQGVAHPVNLPALLKGQEDPPLAPGDIVEVRP